MSKISGGSPANPPASEPNSTTLPAEQSSASTGVIDFYAARERILAAHELGELRMAAGAEGLRNSPDIGDKMGTAPQASRVGGLGDDGGRLPPSHPGYRADLARGIVPRTVGAYGPSPDFSGPGGRAVQDFLRTHRRLNDHDARMLAAFARECMTTFAENAHSHPRTDDKLARAAEMIQSVRATGMHGTTRVGPNAPVKEIRFVPESHQGKDGRVEVVFASSKS